MGTHTWSFRRPSDLEERRVLWPRSLSERFGPSELRGQFRLSRTVWDPPSGWRTDTIREWTLSHHESLSVGRITAGGQVLGWIIGEPILPDGRLVAGDIELPSGWSVSSGEVPESFVEELRGSFIVALVGVASPRLYLDGSGSRGVVFSATRQIVASTVFLIPYAEDGDHLAFVDGPGRFNYDPHLHFGLTVRSSVDWLMPNHYLDLREWRTIRHWPKGPTLFVDNIGETIEFVADRLARNLRSLAEAGPFQMSLTAGKDTRVLLACARELTDRIEFVTHAIPDRLGRVDVSGARHIAHVMKLRHRVIHVRPPTSRELARLLYRTGGVAATDHRCQTGVNGMRAMHAQKPYVAGSGAEIDRMPLYIEIPVGLRQFTIETLLGLRGYPLWPETVERGARWLRELPIENPYTVFDYRALEMRFGGWGGFLPYGYAEGAAFFYYPFGDRSVVQALMSLPPEYRRKDGVTHDVIASRWPELLNFPFNEATVGPYAWYRAVRTFAKHVVKD